MIKDNRPTTVPANLLQHVRSALPSTGDRTILGSISKRGNRYLRVLFVQAAWVTLVKVNPNRSGGHRLKVWIEAARKRLHHNVLAIALANKLARIAWSVLARGRAFEASKLQVASSLWVVSDFPTEVCEKMRRDGGSVFPARANTGDPDGQLRPVR